MVLYFRFGQKNILDSKKVTFEIRIVTFFRDIITMSFKVSCIFVSDVTVLTLKCDECNNLLAVKLTVILYFLPGWTWHGSIVHPVTST